MNNQNEWIEYWKPMFNQYLNSVMSSPTFINMLGCIKVSVSSMLWLVEKTSNSLSDTYSTHRTEQNPRENPFDFPPLRPKLKPWLAGFNWSKISWPSVTIHRLVTEQCWASRKSSGRVRLQCSFRSVSLCSKKLFLCAVFLASLACWHCAFEAQPGMKFLALASTVVTPHNHTVRIARNLSRRRCKYVQMVSSLGFLAPGISDSWSNYVQHALCWPNIIKYPCCASPFVRVLVKLACI